MMNDIAKGHKSVYDLEVYAAKNDTVYGDDAMKLYFTSNHDENSWQGSAIARMGDDARAFFAMAFMFDQSFPLLYTGQEAGIDFRFPFFSKDTVGVDWSANADHADFYATLFDLKHKHPTLWNGAYGGEMALTTDTMANTVMISRTLGDDQVNGYFSFGGGNISPDAPTGTLVVDLPNVKIYASKLD
jgi:hypothetical protein